MYRPYGFTLIELVVALAIVALLAGFAIPAYRQQVAQGHRAAAVTALYRAAQHLEMLDHAPPQVEVARVVGKFAMRGPVPSRRLVVTSWREGHRFERIPADGNDFDRFSTGDTVEVRVQGGLVGIPWIAGVSLR